MWSSGKQSQTEGTASTNALRWEGIWHVGGIEKKPQWLEQREEWEKSRK